MQRSLQDWQGEAVEVAFKPFLLDPSIPAQGYPFLDYMRAKGGGRVEPEQFFEGPRRIGQQAGLVFNFEKITKAPNTLLSHCLVALAPPEKHGDLSEALYAAYFEHGQDIGSLDVLVEIGEAHGLSGGKLRDRLVSPEIQQQVETDAAQAQKLGIRAVPYFVINYQYAFSGAQPPEVILDVLRQVVDMPEG